MNYENGQIIFLGILFSMCFACVKESDKSGTEEILKESADTIPKREIPKELPLSELKSTEFILTLENKLSDSMTSIYAPAFLFAWQEIKEYYKSPIKVSSSNSLDFKLINESKTFQSSLNKDEYQTKIDASGDGVIAEAYFKKTLPFVLKLHAQDDSLLFNGSSVATFGVNWPDYELLDYVKILYYLDDDHFAVKLLPADTTSEIILVEGIDLSGSFSDLYTKANIYIEKGIKDKTIKEKGWRYKFEEQDYLSIPVIKFNIGTHYSSLQGQQFTSGSTSHEIIKAYQRIAFLLDEYGAIVESYAAVACDTTFMSPTPIERPRPKKMVFDNPFVIFIKKKDSSNPYFAMKIMNAELMEKK